MKTILKLLMLVLILSCKKTVDNTPFMPVLNCQLINLQNVNSTTSYAYDNAGFIKQEILTTSKSKIVANFYYNIDSTINKIIVTKNLNPFIIDEITKYQNKLPIEGKSTYEDGTFYIYKLEWEGTSLVKVTASSPTDINTYKTLFEVDKEGNMIKFTQQINNKIAYYSIYERDLKAKQTTLKGLIFNYSFDEYDSYLIPNSVKRIATSKNYKVYENGKEIIETDYVFTNTVNKNNYVVNSNSIEKISNQTSTITFAYTGCD